MPEVHLYIIWANAMEKKEEIIKDISKDFEILNLYNIEWDAINFSKNMSRFYGENLVDNDFKELECGKGRFAVIIVKDNNPSYEPRLTSKGEKLVNSKMFDSKKKFRELTGGGHKIHGTDNIKETKHNLKLLLNINYDDLINLKSISIQNINIDSNLLGAVQWTSMHELFDILNLGSEYVVLRNFHNISDPYKYSLQGDIDILIKNLKEFIYLTNARPMRSNRHNTHYLINVANATVIFDVVTLNHDYIDRHWFNNIIETRELNNNIYIPNKENYKYLLLYHLELYKSTIPDKYKYELDCLFPLNNYLDMLKKFIVDNNYKFIAPQNPTFDLNYEKVNLQKSSFLKMRNFLLYVYKLRKYLKPRQIKQYIKKIIKR